MARHRQRGQGTQSVGHRHEGDADAPRRQIRARERRDVVARLHRAHLPHRRRCRLQHHRAQNPRRRPVGFHQRQIEEAHHARKRAVCGTSELRGQNHLRRSRQRQARATRRESERHHAHFHRLTHHSSRITLLHPRHPSYPHESRLQPRFLPCEIERAGGLPPFDLRFRHQERFYGVRERLAWPSRVSRAAGGQSHSSKGHRACAA